MKTHALLLAVVLILASAALPTRAAGSTAPSVAATFNGAGKLEFQFTVPDNAAFFQLKAQ